MKIILLADIKKVGLRGVIVNVADGYANNVLIPKKLALPATGENLKHWERVQAGQKDRQVLDATLARKALAEIDGKSVSIQALANPSGGLFEAIRAKQVADAIRKEMGVDVPEEAITLIPGPAIKKLGEYRAEVVVVEAKAEIAVVVSKL